MIQDVVMKSYKNMSKGVGWGGRDQEKEAVIMPLQD